MLFFFFFIKIKKFLFIESGGRGGRGRGGRQTYSLVHDERLGNLDNRWRWTTPPRIVLFKLLASFLLTYVNFFFVAEIESRFDFRFSAYRTRKRIQFRKRGALFLVPIVVGRCGPSERRSRPFEMGNVVSVVLVYALQAAWMCQRIIDRDFR